MNMMLLLAGACGLLAVGVSVFAWDLLQRDRRDRQSSKALQTALLRQSQAATRAEHAADLHPLHALLRHLNAFGEHFRGSRLGSILLAPEDRMLLDQAGWNTLSGTSVFLALRLALAILVALLAPTLLGYWGSTSGLIVALVGAAMGLLVPKFVLRAWANRLKRKANDELPLIIDLLRLLQGVGMSMDQSLQMLGEKLKSATPVLGGEIEVANTLYMHGRTREQSLQRLSEIYTDDDLRSLVLLILQVHRHGGSVQEPLRQFAERIREQRRMEMKEKVGKLSVKMTIVMMLTLLPALMLVLSGPAILALAKALTEIGN